MKKSKILAVIASVTILASTNAVFADTQTELVLQIDNPIMTVNGTEKEIDPGMGTSPVIVNNRTLLPVRAVIEEIGGMVDWNGAAQEVTLTYGQDEIRLTIDSTTAYLNNEAQTLDTAPAIINNRTMLPIRFIAESFEFNVDWQGDTQTVTITKEAETAPTNQASLSVKFGYDGDQFVMTVEDNATTKFLMQYLGTESMNLPIYHDGAYEGYEYYDIPSHYKIPDDAKAVTSVKAGEVYYADNQILLYYEDMAVTGDYTKIGTIENTAGLKAAVEENPTLEGWGNKIISLQAIKAN